MTWIIEYGYKDVEQFVLKIPAGLSAKYFHLTDLMLEFKADLGMPHKKTMSDGLCELRVKGKEGIARVFYRTKVRQARNHVARACKEDPKDSRQRIAQSSTAFE